MSKRSKFNSEENFHKVLPRTIFSEANQDRLDKQGTSFTGYTGVGSAVNQIATYGGTNNIFRNPSRRFYDPEITTTAIYLPRTLKQKNRWCRWFYDHDELIGAVLDLHAELPYSRAEIAEEDSSIRRSVEDCFDNINFFSMLPMIDLEFMKIGEIFIHTPWDEEKGMWGHIILHNPDFVEVRFSPFADQECSIELIPDDELRGLVHSTKPEDQQLKRRIPQDVFRRVLTGKNIVLEPEEVTHIARRSNPYDIRGTSIIARIFRLLMYEDKLREAQITIADNFVYPLKIFKLGDPKKGWIPNETHQRALAQMLQQSTFDPNFSLIYHYALDVQFITVADKVMRLEKEWSDIADKKMIALGIGKQFLSGETSYSSANVALQTQLARYKAKRDLFEVKWIRKLLKTMAERNEWYRRDKKELIGQYRVKRKGTELQERLIIPKLIWHKKLMMRDDQAFLTFMHNVYAQGKGPISTVSLLQFMGMNLGDELQNKKKQKELEAKIGDLVHPVTQTMGGGLTARIKEKLIGRKKHSKTESILTDDEGEYLQTQIKNGSKEFVGSESMNKAEFVGSESMNKAEVIGPDQDATKDLAFAIETTVQLKPVDIDTWFNNIESPQIPSEVKLLLINLNNKLTAVDKKSSNDDLVASVNNENKEIQRLLVDLYKQGKLYSYNITGFYPIYRQYYASSDDLTDYSDLVLAQEFERWTKQLTKLAVDRQEIIKHLRNLGNTCFCYGQIKGYQEQGINMVRIGNVLINDGLRYKTKDLLNKGWNLGSLMSTKDEIVILSPCIEGFEDEQFGNSVDTQIERYKNFRTSDIDVKGCPIEFAPIVDRFLNKLGKLLHKKYGKIVFVRDVIDLKEWEDRKLAELKVKHQALSDEMKSSLINSTLQYERIQKRGMVPVFDDGKTIYVSNWIGMEESSLTDKLIKYINIFDNDILKQVRKAFKTANLDLTVEDIQTYRVFGYIIPISDDPKNPRGFKLNEKYRNSSDLDYKLRHGKLWGLDGKCMNGSDNDEVTIFMNNLKLWIDYPHFLQQDLKKSFESLI